MALHLLKPGPPLSHLYRFDLESLFHAMVVISCSYEDGHLRPPGNQSAMGHSHRLPSRTCGRAIISMHRYASLPVLAFGVSSRQERRLHQKVVTLDIPVETRKSLVVEETPPPIPESESAAPELVDRLEAAAEAIAQDDDVADNVVQHNDRTGLLDEQRLSIEMDACVCLRPRITVGASYVSKLLYIRTKLVILEDRRASIGSAIAGDGDSEIGSASGGHTYDALDPVRLVARFAATLQRRKSAPRPHPAPTPNPDEMGTQHDRLVADPLQNILLELWNTTGRKNREIFVELFCPF
ncbi:hypothetical protein C8R45DRAFT_1089108 [Mycena sanguinolenta]|nr:hypothetical protein C8R45DRAFT_1089108 [Mycena sanguinolenta]